MKGKFSVARSVIGFGCVGIALSAPLVFGSDYQFELNLTHNKASVASVSDANIDSADFKYLFKLGKEHKPKYDIFAEQEFLTRKSSIRLIYRDEKLSIKDVARSRSDTRELPSALIFLSTENINTARTDTLSQLTASAASFDFTAAAAALATPDPLPDPEPDPIPGISGLLAEDVEQSLVELTSPTFLSEAIDLDITNPVTNFVDDTELDRETVGIDVKLVFNDKYIFEVAYTQTDASTFTRSFDFTSSGASVDIVNLGIANGALSISPALFDVDQPDFVFTPPITFSTSAETFSTLDEFDLSHDTLGLGIGTYLTDTSALRVLYERSESDAKLDVYERDYDKVGVSYKLITTPEELKGVIAFEADFSRLETQETGYYLQYLSTNFNYYPGKRFSVGAGIRQEKSSAIDSNSIVSFNTQYFLNKHLAIRAGVEIENARNDSDVDLPNREIFTATLTGRL